MVSMNWVIGSLAVIMIGVSALLISGAYFMSDLKARIYPNGDQTLATKCYVNEKVKTNEVIKYDGYALVPSFARVNTKTGLPDKYKEEVSVIESRETEVKVRYIEFTPYGESKNEVWIPKTDFFKYPSQNELAKMYSEYSIKENKKK